MITGKLHPGDPNTLGANWDGLGVNFAVFSAHAEKVELCLFDPTGRREVARLELPDCTNEIFNGYLPEARPGLLYGYRVYGPYEPEAGHRFNPNKLLLDPYAKKIFGQLHWSDALYGYRVGSGRDDLSFDRRDSAAAMPKAVIVDNLYNWGDDAAPRVPWKDSIIYEAHLRGLTMRRDDLPLNERGTFAGLADPRLIDHLVNLGITAIELLPIQSFLQDRFLVAKRLRNYWGYQTLGFFAPEPSYISAADGTLNEVRVAIRRLHEAGIEVILDVVYNHTCEGGETGPTLSWRGFDNLSYYRAAAGAPRHLVNDTGTGNTINISHPRVLQMVLDSLRHWALSYRVDGFRFDLCSTLGRELSGFDPHSGFFDAIRQDPVLSKLKLIAEPWDIGPGGYQLGNNPPGFAEWNDRFRDGVRRFWRGDPGQRSDLAARLLGSSDIFEHHRRKPWSSVNFVAAHDGFTTADTTRYNERHNEANGEDNKDGHSENYSNNWGVEGETDDPAINLLRERTVRSLLSTLFFSHGTPMLLGGDEMGRTQNGNSNAYCQDNETSWIDWSGLRALGDNAQKALLRFTTKAIALRKSHPSLRSAKFLHGTLEVLPGIIDVAWFDETAAILTMEAWNDPAGKRVALRRAVVHADVVDMTLLLLNASNEDREFDLPNPELEWEIELDSAAPDAPSRRCAVPKTMVGAHCAVLLSVEVELP
jgi:glycogen operon protein